ncbi:MAG: THUMP domain-containing protein [Melioribacteraceae bacterium]
MKDNKIKFIAKTFAGLEEVLAEELLNIGASDVSIQKRAVSFVGDEKLLYTANLSLRTCLRILKPIHKFNAINTDQLYRNIQKYDWTNLISVDDTFAIDSVVHSEYFKHSKYAALKVKDAIVDQIRYAKGKRPNIDIEDPTFRINLHIDQNVVTISLDSSGESLHRRSYRLDGEKAPLNEVLAVGMILLSGWNGQSNFVDPMCGSGTLVVEAAMLAKNIAPNFKRNNFGFMNWKSFDKKLYVEVKEDLVSNQNKFEFRIIGSDISSRAIESAKKNAERAEVFDMISFEQNDYEQLEHNLDSGVIITNPPYGERLKQININDFYKNLGDTFKNNFSGFDAWVFSANKEALKNIGLRTSRRLVLYNGSLECKFHCYQLYRGSKKAKFKTDK